MQSVRWVLTAGLGLFALWSGAAQAERNKPAVTFSRDVAPILFTNCANCHRPGSIAPFSLLTYQDAKKRAKQIALITEKEIMPPWKPQPGHGSFRGERRLTEAQRATLKAWAEADAPEGSPTDLPPTPKFREGWQLGTPDIILKMPKPFTIPADGRDIYVHFVFPLNLSRDIHVRGVECRPSNPKVAHHAIGLLDGSGTARKLDAQTPEPGYLNFGAPGFIPAGFTPGYVPGQTPGFFDPGCAITIKPGTDFVLQMHYHPSGKAETDQTEIGLYLSKQPPTKHMLGVLLGSEEIDIPANTDTFKAFDRFELPVPLKVTSIWAHMHLIGREARVWAELPDGSKRRLLWINDWDFNWQETYAYREPIYLPKGAVIRVEARFDNTANNPRNPHRPPQRVRLGEQSTDEMLGIWVGGEVSNILEQIGLLAANVGHYFEYTERGKKFRTGR